MLVEFVTPPPLLKFFRASFRVHSQTVGSLERLELTQDGQTAHYSDGKQPLSPGSYRAFLRPSRVGLDNQKRNIFKDNLGGIREDNALLLAYHCSAGENPDQEYEDPLRSKKENMNVRYRLMADVDDTTD